MLRPMAILSIQSAVAYGHVGNAAAVFPLQRLGFEVWRVDTVLFSNHTGYGAWRGQVLDPVLVGEILKGIEERGAFPRCEAVLSGYLGSAQLGAVILDSVRAVKRANPHALYACDPVMGDAEKGLYVQPDLPGFFRGSALPMADIVTPNQFELENLSGKQIATLAEMREAANAVLAMGPHILLVTSLAIDEVPPDRIAMLAVTGEGGWLIATPRLKVTANGAGDLTAALFLAHYLKTRDATAALGATAASVHAVLAETLRSNAPELAIVAAQDAIVWPKHRFSVDKVF